MLNFILKILILILFFNCDNKNTFKASGKKPVVISSPSPFATVSPIPLPTEPEKSPDTTVIIDNGGESVNTVTVLSSTNLISFNQTSAVEKKIEPEERNYVWSVTLDHKATYLNLSGKKISDLKIDDEKVWTGVNNHGTGYRTYVLEGGSIVIVAGYGHVYWIDPSSTPTNVAINYSTNNDNHYLIPDIDGHVRGCPVSYKKNGKKYLGIGYGIGHFREVPLSDQPPYKPLFNEISSTYTISGGKHWGYSCYIDQFNLVYYGAFRYDPAMAFDLKNLIELPATRYPPNAGFTSETFNNWIGPKNEGGGTYAISGDLQGNILNAKNTYTMTHEPKSDTIWVTDSVYWPNASYKSLLILPRSCVYKDATCVNYGSYDMTNIDGAGLNVYVKPISSLGNGIVIGQQRNYAHQIVALALKDPLRPNGGVDAKVLKKLASDPYMYTDFTGGTLYMTKTVNEFDLKSIKDFNPNKKNGGLGFKWIPRDPNKGKFENIQLEIRCYNSIGAATLPAYESAMLIMDSGVETNVTSQACSNNIYDHVDIRLIQLNNADTLMNVASISLSVYQEK